MTFPASDEEDEDRLLRQQYSKSGLSEGHSYGSSTNLYHPRYNTPVSEINNNNNNNNTNNDMEVVVNIEDVGAATRTMIEYEDEEAKPDLTRIVSREARAEDGKLTKSSGTSPAGDQRTVGGRSVEQSCSTMMVSADGATSCPTSVDIGWCIDNLKRCQTTRTNSSCFSLNTVSAAALVPLDMARSALPLKGTFPSFEILPGTGGRLVRFQFVVIIFPLSTVSLLSARFL